MNSDFDELKNFILKEIKLTQMKMTYNNEMNIINNNINFIIFKSIIIALISIDTFVTFIQSLDVISQLTQQMTHFVLIIKNQTSKESQIVNIFINQFELFAFIYARASNIENRFQRCSFYDSENH